MQNNILNWIKLVGPWGVIGIIVAIFVIVAMGGVYSAIKRAKALKELASTLGFEYVPSAEIYALRGLAQFKILSTGDNRQILNLLKGSTESTEVNIFDWQYSTGAGKHRRTHVTTIVAIQSAELNLSPFFVRPSTMMDWMGLTFDGRDINFDDRPLFSKKFHLHGNNERQVRQLFDVEVCEYFESHLEASAEGRSDWMIYYLNDRTIKPAVLQEHFKEAFALYVLFKTNVTKDQDPV